MQEFKHVNAKTFEEASRELADGRKVDNLAMAGRHRPHDGSCAPAFSRYIRTR